MIDLICLPGRSWGVIAVGTNRYLGWLLHVNRRLGCADELRSGRKFAGAFHDDRSPRLAPSQVTRWENGRLAPSRDVVGRYEQLLGLAPESLMTVADAVMRSAGQSWMPRDSRNRDREEDRALLFDLLDRVTTAGPMAGGDWTALAWLVSHRPDLELYPPRLWQDIADRLLHELVAAAGVQWLQRAEAMNRLLRHPSAYRPAVAACITMSGDPMSPAVIEPLSLLDASADPAANEYVLHQIEHPDDARALQGALLAAISKVGRGHFRASESRRLVASIGALLRDSALDGAVLPLVVELARRLAQQPRYAGSFARHLPAAEVARQIWTGRRTAEPTAAQVTSARIAARAQSRLPYHIDGEDTVLAELVEESLFMPSADHRLLATMLIAATPYREPFARALLDEVKADLAHRRGLCPLDASMTALTLSGVDIHRPLIRSILTEPGFDADAWRAAAWATPHCAGRFTTPVWRQILSRQLSARQQPQGTLNETILLGITYGIGTDGHHGLLADVRDHPFLPPKARTMASWRLRTTSPASP